MGSTHTFIAGAPNQYSVHTYYATNNTCSKLTEMYYAFWHVHPQECLISEESHNGATVAPPSGKQGNRNSTIIKYATVMSNDFYLKRDLYLKR